MSNAGKPCTKRDARSDAEGQVDTVLQHYLTWLFSAPRDPGFPRNVLVWWEARRLPFNLIIGTYGILCLAVFLAAITTSHHLQAGEDAVEPLALMAAPLVVNILYTLGWIVEVTYRSIEPDVSPRFGPRLLKVGIGLGLFMCTLPAGYWAGYWLLEWVW